MNENSALARRNLDKRLAPLRRSAAFMRPPRGWVRAIRDALGMTAGQLADRLGVSQPRVTALERNEIEDRLTLGKLRQAAEALDCTLVYALVPNRPLGAMVEERARALADRQLARIHHTMRLEDQALTAEDLAAERERLVAEYLRGNPRRLWDEE